MKQLCFGFPQLHGVWLGIPIITLLAFPTCYRPTANTIWKWTWRQRTLSRSLRLLTTSRRSKWRITASISSSPTSKRYVQDPDRRDTSTVLEVHMGQLPWFSFNSKTLFVPGPRSSSISDCSTAVSCTCDLQVAKSSELACLNQKLLVNIIERLAQDQEELVT